MEGPVVEDRVLLFMQRPRAVCVDSETRSLWDRVVGIQHGAA